MEKDLEILKLKDDNKILKEFIKKIQKEKESKKGQSKQSDSAQTDENPGDLDLPENIKSLLESDD